MDPILLPGGCGGIRELGEVRPGDQTQIVLESTIHENMESDGGVYIGRKSP